MVTRPSGGHNSLGKQESGQVKWSHALVSTAGCLKTVALELYCTATARAANRHIKTKFTGDHTDTLERWKGFGNDSTMIR